MNLTEQQFTDKKKELDKLAKSIDIWTGVDMNDEKQSRIEQLFNDMQNAMYELECDFLETKLAFFEEIYKKIKEE